VEQPQRSPARHGHQGEGLRWRGQHIVVDFPGRAATPSPLICMRTRVCGGKDAMPWWEETESCSGHGGRGQLQAARQWACRSRARRRQPGLSPGGTRCANSHRAHGERDNELASAYERRTTTKDNPKHERRQGAWSYQIS
jgi:hypothetical protein